MNLISTFDRFLYRELIQGVRARGGSVDFRYGLLYPMDAVSPENLDVYITWIRDQSELTCLEHCGVPVINFTYVMPTAQVHQVTHDQAAIGQVAASHIQELGRQRPMCLGLKNAYSLERLRGFQVSWSRDHAPAQERYLDTHMELSQLLPGLLEADTDVDALFCSSDELVLYAVLCVEQLGLRVPQDLAVLGVGYEEIHSLALGRRISSVVTDYRALAVALLACLDRVAADPRSPACLERVAPLGLIPGETTAPRMPADPRLRAAQQLLLGGNLQGIDLQRLAAVAGMSRRSFERHFQQECGRAPGRAILEARMSLARRLLPDPERSVESIAELCGYADRYHFSVRFKAESGYSPAAYRNRVRHLQS